MLTRKDSTALNPQSCAEYIRTVMKRYLTFKYTKGGELYVIETTLATELRFREVLGSESETMMIENLLVRIAIAIEQPDNRNSCVILTSFDIRRKLKETIEIEFPFIQVLSRNEIEEQTVIRKCGMIAWDE